MDSPNREQQGGFMAFFDAIFGRCFAAGLLVSQAFAALLYLSILLLTVWTVGQFAWWLIA